MIRIKVKADWKENADYWFGQTTNTDPAFEVYIDKPGYGGYGNTYFRWIVSIDWDSDYCIGAGFAPTIDEAKQACTTAVETYLTQRGS